MGSAPAQIPTSFGHELRACLRCRLVKTYDQFRDAGCENCPFFKMEEDHERIVEVTTPNFNGDCPKVYHASCVEKDIKNGDSLLCNIQVSVSGDFRKMHVFLKDIVPAAQNNINTRFIILEKARSAANGKTCIALAADETAAVHIQLWGDECDAFEAGDIVKLTNGIFLYVRNSELVLRAGKRGKMEKMGEFTVAFVESPNVSEIQWNPDPDNPKRYIQNGAVSPYSRMFPPLP